MSQKQRKNDSTQTENSTESGVDCNRSNSSKCNLQLLGDSDDPLNWPMWLKIVILTQTSLLAAIGGLNTATINPALVQLAQEFQISTVRASYQTQVDSLLTTKTVCIALNGIAPWLWIPLAHKYGRRPIYLGTTLLAFASILGCAYAQSFAQLLVARVFNGFFPVGFALGATSATDLFFYHQRGRALGFFTVTVVNGSHLAPIIGGLLGQYCGWRWIFKFLAIVDAVLFIIAVFCLPETRYSHVKRGNLSRENPNYSKGAAQITSRDSVTTLTSDHVEAGNQQVQPSTPYNLQTYLKSMRIISTEPDYSLHPRNFILPSIRMALYPSAIFPAIYYATMYGFASILPAVTAAAIFTEFFHWNTLTIGLTYGSSLTIGGILGELVSGWVCDLIVKRAARAQNRSPGCSKLQPELRLRPVWAGEIITVAGLLMYGFTLQYRTSWFLPIFGMGLSCFGLQIITTTMYTYAIDTHKSHSAEVAQLFNFVRQMFGMTYAFYVVRMGEKIGFQWTFLIFAVCGGVLAFLPIVGLMMYGNVWRRKAEQKWGKAD